jgi:hypothetical protein
LRAKAGTADAGRGIAMTMVAIHTDTVTMRRRRIFQSIGRTVFSIIVIAFASRLSIRQGKRHLRRVGGARSTSPEAKRTYRHRAADRCAGDELCDCVLADDVACSRPTPRTP